MTDRLEFPQSRCRLGIATGDITPRIGTYHRMWGAAAHDQSTGIHRPWRQVTLAIGDPSDAADQAPNIFIALDHCLFGVGEMSGLLENISSRTGISADRIVFFFSHTHGAGLLGKERTGMPGGEYIPEYFAWLVEHLSVSIHQAVRGMRDATIAYGTGHCSLAANRDYYDPDTGMSVCGFNPDGETDSTLLTARITDDADGGRTMAIVVNYACHPTTLAWDNTRISPDYVGAMREMIENDTQAPVFFLQGASGDLGPRDGFVGDAAVADRNGRQAGYAALSTLESIPPPGYAFQYSGAVVSGATIGTWKWEPVDDRKATRIQDFHIRFRTIDLPYRADRLKAEQLQKERETWLERERSARESGDDQAAADARAMVERMTRRLARIELLPEGDTYPFPVRLWKLGDAVWVAIDGEPYNLLQRELRKRFPRTPIIVGTLANGSSVWYLPDRSSFGKGLYQEDASLLAEGSLETLIEALADDIAQLLKDT